MSHFVAAEPIAPGEYLQDELDARGWTHADLASILGISRRQVVNLVQGKSGITPDIAISLAHALEQDAETWMHLQVAFELAKIAQEDRVVKKRAAAYTKVPVREMVKRGWIQESDDPELLTKTICSFLRISRIDEEPLVSCAARKSDSYAGFNESQIAWYFRAMQLAECVSAAKFDLSKIENAITELRTLALNRPDVRRIPRLLADYGIRLVIVQHLSKAKIDGCTFWLGNSPVITLSLRFDRIDNLWHTLMHEMIHVKYREGSIDVELIETPDEDLPDYEKRANREAAEYLISKEKMEAFILRTKPLYYKKKVEAFACARQIHPGIVVGQLQRRKEIEYYQLRAMLEPIRDEIVGNALTDGWGDCPAIGA